MREWRNPGGAGLKHTFVMVKMAQQSNVRMACLLLVLEVYVKRFRNSHRDLRYEHILLTFMYKAFVDIVFSCSCISAMPPK